MKINLKEKRIEQKLTQQQLAKAIGSGQSSVSRFESGKLRPKPEIAQRIYEEEEADDA